MLLQEIAAKLTETSFEQYFPLLSKPFLKISYWFIVVYACIENKILKSSVDKHCQRKIYKRSDQPKNV